MRIKNEYLYREEPPPPIDQEAITIRIEMLNETLRRLLATDYTRRDTPRILAVTKAIAFWSAINDQ